VSIEAEAVAAAATPSPDGLGAQAPGLRTRRRARWRVTEILSLTWLAVLVIGMLVLPPLLHLNAQNLSVQAQLKGPSASHLLGTDNLGRDLLARTLSGAHVSLAIGFGSVAIAAAIGIPIGMLAGYWGGIFSSTATFAVDVILAFPGLILALTLSAFIGASFSSVLVAITVPLMPVFVRLSKAQTASVLEREYVAASRVIGTPMLSILRRDILPNIAESMVSFALVSVGSAILIESGLAFLGLGVPPPQPTWGSMISDGQDYLTTGPQMIIVPAAFLLLTILSLNLLADRFLADQRGNR
jgi:peptide/nickel transport system permease protein